MKSILCLFGLLLSASIASAQDVAIGTPVYGGNGCPKQTVSTTVAPDSLSISVIYDNMNATLAAADKRRLLNLHCEILIPIQLPAGTSLQVTNIDYRGFVALPTAGQARMGANYAFFPPARNTPWWQYFGRTVGRKFKAPFMDDYTLSTGDGDHGPASACGGKVYLRLSDNIAVRSPAGNEAQITLDSLDGTFASQVSATLKKCR